MLGKVGNFIKDILKLNFDLKFTSSKLLAYIIVAMGFALTFKIGNDDIWMWTMIAATGLFGVKVWSNKQNDK